jgi:chromosomal replication initiation ATPase DnaA
MWRETESSEIKVSKISLKEMMQRAADMLQVKVDLLRQKNRTKELADVRAAICYLAVRECNLSGVAVARALNMTRSGVSVAVKRGGEIVSGNPALRGKLVD